MKTRPKTSKTALLRHCFPKKHAIVATTVTNAPQCSARTPQPPSLPMGSSTKGWENIDTRAPSTLEKHLKSWQTAIADVVLTAGDGTKLHCHSLFLAVHSRVFQQCLFGEGTTTATPENPVVFEQAFASKTGKELVLLVGYMYSLTPEAYVNQV